MVTIRGFVEFVYEDREPLAIEARRIIGFIRSGTNQTKLLIEGMSNQILLVEQTFEEVALMIKKSQSYKSK